MSPYQLSAVLSVLDVAAPKPQLFAGRGRVAPKLRGCDVSCLGFNKFPRPNGKKYASWRFNAITSCAVNEIL
jgi:hypothetical protein